MKTNKYQQPLRYWWREWLKPLVVILVITSTLRSTLADWNDVPSGSMKPTILEGDRIWVNKLAYDLKFPFTTLHMAEWNNPGRGDIVVCYSPHDGKRLVKRVVGLPGDRLEMLNRRLTINGEPVACLPPPFNHGDVANSQEPGAQVMVEYLPRAPHLTLRMSGTSPAASFGPFTVPEGRYFLMGDNRDVSFDSRYFGCVSRTQIIGRAEAVVVSVDPGHYYLPRLSRCFKKLL